MEGSGEYRVYIRGIKGIKEREDIIASSVVRKEFERDDSTPLPEDITVPYIF